MANGSTGGGGHAGVSIYGDQFVARIDFSKALADSRQLDQNIQATERSLESFVARGTSRLAALAAAFDRVAASVGRADAALLGAGAGGAFAVTGGQPSVGRTQTFVGAGGNRTTHPQPGLGVAPSTPRLTSGRDPNWVWHMDSRAGPVVGRIGTGRGAALNQQNYDLLQRMGLISEFPVAPQLGRGAGPQPYASGPMGQNWQWWGASGPPAAPPRYTAHVIPPPAGALPPPPPTDTWSRSYGGGNWEILNRPGWYSPNFARGYGAGQFMRNAYYNVRGFGSAVGAGVAGFAGSAGMTMQGIGNVGSMFSWQNMLRAATGLYIGRALGSAVGGISSATLGRAAAEQEARELLGVTLTDPYKLGISPEEGRSFASELVGSRYLAGIGVSAVGLGLSRTDIAEQYRQLAPLVRLSADDPSDFVTGLQRGSLARQLLVARDPIQGTRGAMVSLSELYSGGPDRFRSLALRFELPRTRLLEIEQELQAQGGFYDPADIVIRMLGEMGMGEEYVERRARSTLQGQVDRTGALWTNFRIDAFQSALSGVIANMDRLNNSIEAWANSPAYDRLIEQIDGFFGGVFESVTGWVTNWATGAMLREGGEMSPRHLGGSMVDFIRYSGGQFLNAAGDVATAAEVIREAAQEVSGDHLRTLLSNPRFDAGAEAARESALWGAMALSTGALADRFLLGGTLGPAVRGAPGARVALGASVGGLLAGVLPGIAISTLIGAGVGGARSAGKTLDLIAAAQGSAIPSMFDTPWSEESLLTRFGIIGSDPQQALLRSVADAMESDSAFVRRVAQFNLWTESAATNLVNMIPGFSREGSADRGSAEGSVVSYAAALAQHIYSSAEDPGALTRQEVRDRASTLLWDAFESNPKEFPLSIVEMVDAAERAAATSADPFRFLNEPLLHGIVNRHLLYNRGLEIAGPDGQTFGISEEEIPDYIANRDLVDQLVGRVMTAYEGDGGTLNTLLQELLATAKEIGNNTGVTAEAAAKTVSMDRVRLSSMAGLFYGYDPDADRRTVVPGHGIRPELEQNIIEGADYTTGGRLTRSASIVTDGGNRRYDGQMNFGVMGATAITSTPGEVYGPEVGGGLAGKRHSGFDLRIGKAGQPDPIFSPFHGGAEVVEIGYAEGGLGHYAHLRTQTGRIVRMGHFDSAIPWEVGDTIPHGHMIGIEGTSGNSTGHHLHVDYLGAGKANRDSSLFREFWMEDTMPLDAPVPEASVGEPVAVEININVDGSGDPEATAQAVRRELERMERDGELAASINRVAAHRRRQGGTLDGHA